MSVTFKCDNCWGNVSPLQHSKIVENGVVSYVFDCGDCELKGGN